MDAGATASGPTALLICASVQTSIGANGGACNILLHEMQEALCDVIQLQPMLCALRAL